MRVLALIFFLAFFAFALGQEKAGQIVDVKGRVKIYKPGKLRGLTVKEPPQDLTVGDRLRTDFRSMAFVKLKGVGKIVVMENSLLYVEGLEKLSMGEGRAVFRIAKREAGKGLKIRVRSVIIGVKGTEFLVSAEGERIGIFLREGSLKVESLEGGFKKLKEEVAEDFEEFKRQIEEGMREEEKAYEEFKKQVEKEFYEFVKEFYMEGTMAVVIEDGFVREVDLPAYVEEEFKLLDAF